VLHVHAKNVVIFLYVLFLTTSCYSESLEGDEARVRGIVEIYYDLEMRQDWDGAYAHRLPVYREVITIDEYRNGMLKDSMGWQLLEYKINTVDISIDSAVVSVSVVEKVPKSHELRDMGLEIVRFNGNVVFKKLSDVWYIKDAFTRGHMNYNASLVEE